jgi:hypothetical protein
MTLMDQNAQSRRPHYHRGRRGPDRRGPDRRAPRPSQEQTGRPSGDAVDVEQIMRDIRARIAQRHGIELSTPQIQELAARRLEAILDPRTISPSLMEQLRRGAAAPAEMAAPAPRPGFSFTETTLFETHRGVLRLIRRLLAPILKLFFNPTPLSEALAIQARLNEEAAVRDAEQEQRQTEWNALHYEILQRLVTEVSRVSIDMQALALHVESLSARVDFNDRRVRSMESVGPQGRGHGRAAADHAPVAPAPPTAPAVSGGREPVADTATPDATPAVEGTRRKRRRRRGRRSVGGVADDGVVESDVESGAVETGTVDTDAVTADAAGTDVIEADTLETGAGAPEAAGAGAVEAEPVEADAIDAAAVESPTPERDAVETGSAEAVAFESPAAVPGAAPGADPAADARDEAARADAPPAPVEPPAPAQPTPPPDEPVPGAPVDRPDPGPPDR